jgi:hypothetical protein
VELAVPNEIWSARVVAAPAPIAVEFANAEVAPDPNADAKSADAIADAPIAVAFMPDEFAKLPNADA